MNQQTPKLAIVQPGLAKSSVDSSFLSYRKSAFAMSRVVFFLIGLLLSVTAGLKLWMLLTDPFADLHSGFPFSVLWIGIFTEILLIFIVLRIDSVILKLSTTFLFFTATFAISASRLFMGFESCGCAGGIALPTWFSVLLNLSVIAALLSVAQKNGGGIIKFLPIAVGEIRSLPPAAKGGVTGFLIIAVLFSISQGQFVPQFLDRLALSKISIESVNLGEINSGETAHSSIHIKNSSADEFRVIGGARSCQCVAIQTKNLRIPPHADVEVSVLISPSLHSKGVFRHRLTFLLDKRPKRVSVDLTGFVKEGNSHESKHN